MSKKYITDVIKIDGQLLDGNGSAGTSGQVLSSTGTATDWVSLSEISGVDGSGAANYLAKWSDGDSITNSVIYDNGTNVGIGTPSPGYPLDIAGFANSSSGFRVTDGTIDNRISWSSGNVGFFGTISNHPIAFNTNLTERIRITSGGNVGIGTTDPLAKFDVALNEANSNTAHYIQLSNIAAGYVDWAFSKTFSNDMSITNRGTGNGDTPVMTFKYVANGGNVGIGTTSPANKLDVKISTSNRTTLEPVLSVSANGSGPYTGFGPKISFSSNIYYGATTGNPAGIIETAYIGAVMGSDYDNNSDLVFATRQNATSVTEKMRILGNGNVGIGTTGPVAKLEVSGTVKFVNSGFAGFEAHNTNGTWESFIGTETGGGGNRYNSASSQHTFYNNSSAVVRIDTSGNVGIGTTNPQAQLQIDTPETNGAGQGLRINRPSAGTHYHSVEFATNGTVDWSVGQNNNDAFEIYEDGLAASTRFTIKEGGNVGIGTTSPQDKLSVIGTVNASSLLATNPSNTSFTEGAGATNGQIYLSPTRANRSLSITTQQLAAGDDIDGVAFNAFYTNTAGPVDLLFRNGGNNNFYIKQNGNVGIADTPSFKLDVNVTSSRARFKAISGDANIELSSIAGHDWLIQSKSDSSLAIYDEDEASERMRITSAGNVGIGTTNPGAKLQVGGGTSNQQSSISCLSGSFQGLLSTLSLVNQTANLVTNGGVALDFHLNSAYSPTGRITTRTENVSDPTRSYMQFFTYNNGLSEKMRITSDGKVGIGVTSPGTRLQVNDYNYNGNGVSIYGYSNNEMLSLISRYDQSGGGLFFKRGDNGSEAIIGEINWVSNQFRVNATIGSMAIQTSNSTAITIDSSQQVGINETNPSQKLHVNGNARVTGFYYDSNNSAGTPGQVLSSTSGGTAWDTLTASDVGAAPTSHTHAATDITSGTFADARIALTNITQHTDPKYLRSDASDTASELITFQKGISQDGNAKFYTWRALNNTSDTSNQYYRIARITSTQSSRFAIELAGRSTSYADPNIPAIGFIVGQLNNDNDYDIVFYNHSTGTSEVVLEVGQVDVSTTDTDIYIRTIQYAEISATGHISDGSITTYGGDNASTTAPTNYVAATEVTVWNSGNDGSGSGLDADLLDGNHASAFALSSHNHDSDYVNVTGDTMTGNLIIGLGSSNNYVRSYHSDGAYTEMRGYGLEMSRTSSYIRPTIDNSQTLYIGTDSTQWATLSIDSSTTAFKTNGSEHMRIDSSGNVGIGTTSPNSKLTINGGINNVWSYSTATTDQPGFVAANNTSFFTQTNLLYSKIYGSDITATAFGVTLGNYAVVSTDGSDNNGLLLGTFNAKPLIIGTNAGERMRITSGGNVGIGTTSPGAKLTVAGSAISISNGWTGNHDILFVGGSASSTGSANQTAARIRSTASVPGGLAVGDLLFTVNSGDAFVDALYIKEDGNVGIGTTSPGAKLEIKTATSNTTSVEGLRLYNAGGSVGAGVKIGLGVGSTYSEKAYLRTDIINGGAGRLFIGVNGSDRVLIDSSGNVGIGETSPSYKLSVAGGVLAGGKTTYTKTYSSLDTTGNAVAGLTSGTNGQSSLFTFTCFGHTGGYQKIVYSCHNVNGTWNTKKVIDEGTNDFDMEASANGTTITFTFKSTSGTKYYSPKVIVEAAGSAINSTYA